jgi:hypothetical protein
MNLTDREKIEGLRQRYNHFAASHSFLSLYIYGDGEGYDVSLSGDGFYVTDRAGDILFPVGSDEYKRRFIEQNRGKRIYMMRECDVDFVKSVIPGFVCEPTPERDEYVYSRTEQVSLEGHKFQKVRAKLSRFYRENAVENRAITKENINDAYGILSSWTPKSGEGDAGGAKKALDNFFALGLLGMITYIDDQPVGYCLGGDICGGVFMLCSAKQISDAQGLNISTKHELFKALPEGITKINTESDHGSPGIRMHKNDMRPVYLNKTYKGML